MSKLVLLIVVIIGMAAPFGLLAAPEPPDYRFKVEVLATGMPQPMELEVARDGRVFFNEIGGKLKIYKPGTGEVVLAGEIPVFTEQENGFLGFALDPNFERNSGIYIFYSPPDFPGSRLSRFEMEGDRLILDSERMILQFEEQRLECCHHAGSVEFGPDGTLYISTGDNTHPGGDSDGYAPIDERPGKEPFDAQKGSSNTHDLRGKILRIRPLAEGGYTIPDGNLFPRDGSQGRPEIFVMGCRNPWRMTVDQKTGFVYWGDVGPDAGGDGARGSRGYDELNQARRAGNFGWPYFVGKNFPYSKYDFATRTAGPMFDPARPTNSSPSNTGAHVLPPAQPALIYWPYGESKEFPMLGSGGRTACAGPVFYFQDHFRQTGGFPEYFDGCLLFFDWQRPFIKWARLSSDGDLAGIEPFTGAVTVVNDRDRALAARNAGQFVVQRPVDAQFGPDGCLYLLDYGETWGANKDAQLVRISYQWGNLAPVARMSVNPSAGREPLAVELSSAGSFDQEGDPIRFSWLLHPGGAVFSTEPNPVLTIAEPGNYVVELRVSDDRGATTSTSLPLIVGNTPPELAFLAPEEGDFFTPGEAIVYRIAVKDEEDGNSEQDDELFESRTFLSASWARGDGKVQAAEPGLAGMKQSDCFNCHATEQKVVGPSFVEIAERYRSEAEAFETAVQRIIHGSSGVWSEIPMLPHAALNPDQVRMMVRWIFALEPGKGGDELVRGLSGSVKAPADEKLQSATLEASYTDSGRGDSVGALSGQASVRLRSRRMEPEFADEKHGAKILSHFLGGIDHGHHARFANVNLRDSGSATFRVASAGQGGRIEVRLGAPDGQLLGEVAVEPTGGWDKWVELKTELVPVARRGEIYLVFVNPGKSGLMNLDWVHFHSRD